MGKVILQAALAPSALVDLAAARIPEVGGLF